MKTLHIITPCSRPENIYRMGCSFKSSLTIFDMKVIWHVSFQNASEPDLSGAVKNNKIIEMIPDDEYIYLLDDDNLMRPMFLAAVERLFKLCPDKRAFVFSQERRDELGPVLIAEPENMKLYKIDTAQVVFQKSLLGELRLQEDSRYWDGILFEELFKRHPEDFYFQRKPALVRYNALTWEEFK